MKFKLLLSTTAALLLLAGCQMNTAEESTASENNSTEESQASSESQLSSEEQKEQEMIAELPEEASTDDWNLILVNREHPLPEDFSVEMETVQEAKDIDARIVEPYKNWMNAALEAGYNIFLASSYRSVELQETNYNNSIQRYINEGHSEEEAIKLTEDYIALPGSSEHHTGLAIDIAEMSWFDSGHGLEPEYDTQESQHWLVDTAADYGFVLRFPEDKEEATGISYESWHFRYVGEENAKFMEKYNLALEEYVALLEKTGKTGTEE